tara:strand:- start:6788 stop:7024 length:237 start_codon:yes stop_codon:yes gene_type:complete
LRHAVACSLVFEHSPKSAGLRLTRAKTVSLCKKIFLVVFARVLGEHGMDLGALLLPESCITRDIAAVDILGVLNREGF